MNRKQSQQALRILFAATSLFLLQSCATGVNAKATGSLKSGVKFYLFDYFSGKPMPFGINFVIVTEMMPSRSELTVWHVSGDQSLQTLVYGSKYPGLKDSVPAHRLERGKKYSAAIYMRTGVIPHVVVYFGIDHTGAVVFERTERN